MANVLGTACEDWQKSRLPVQPNITSSLHRDPFHQPVRQLRFRLCFSTAIARHAGACLAWPGVCGSASWQQYKASSSSGVDRRRRAVMKQHPQTASFSTVGNFKSHSRDTMRGHGRD